MAFEAFVLGLGDVRDAGSHELGNAVVFVQVDLNVNLLADPQVSQGTGILGNQKATAVAGDILDGKFADRDSADLNHRFTLSVLVLPPFRSQVAARC